MPAVGIAILGNGVSISKDECNLNNPCESSSHQGITKCCMDHSAEHKVLRMCRHRPPSDCNDETRNEVPLWCSVPLPAQPNPSKAGAPPDNTHSSMLDIIADPCTSPSVLRERIDAAPSSDQSRIEEFLGPACSLQPPLSDKQDEREKDTITDKRTSHDEMRKTLTKMVIAAVSQCSDSTKQHLYPSNDWHSLSDDSVSVNSHLTNLTLETLCDMELKVDTKYYLNGKHKHQDVGEFRVYIRRKDSSAVHMSQEVCCDCYYRSEDLCRYVPSIPNDLYIMLEASLNSPIELYTPRTIPTGKMMPKDSIINNICAHSIESCHLSATW